MPPLKGPDGKWCLDSLAKANLLAETWDAKCKLPADVEGQFVPHPLNRQQAFVAIRSRTIFTCLSRLDVNCATGPDRISARILKELASVITTPLTILSRRILYEATWPERWKVHYLIPIYKKDSVYEPKHYRGVHLTCILSKVVEKTIGNPLITFLSQHGYGDNQWGFRKQSSASDLVLVCVSKWILAACMRQKVAVYLGDITKNIHGIQTHTSSMGEKVLSSEQSAQ